jgi:hypothetical protein
MTTFIIASAILNALVLCLAVARLYHVRKRRGAASASKPSPQSFEAGAANNSVIA